MESVEESKTAYEENAAAMAQQQESTAQQIAEQEEASREYGEQQAEKYPAG